ncbi:hypothetical protein GGF37_004009, partial [Kickxella alabastrina]
MTITYFVPSLHLGSDAEDKQSSNNNSGKHTNSEFASMMDSCKSQVRNLQDATKNPDNKAVHHCNYRHN